MPYYGKSFKPYLVPCQFKAVTSDRGNPEIVPVQRLSDPKASASLRAGAKSPARASHWRIRERHNQSPSCALAEVPSPALVR